MYELSYHPLAYKADLKTINPADQKRIIRTIEKRLSTHPEEFGKPLKGTLRGYWKLRIGEYRVVYRIEKGEVKVYVILIGYRRNKEVYEEAIKRLGVI